MEYNTQQIRDPASALIFGILQPQEEQQLLFIIYYPFSYIWLQWHKQTFLNNVFLEFQFTKKAQAQTSLTATNDNILVSTALKLASNCTKSTPRIQGNLRGQGQTSEILNFATEIIIRYLVTMDNREHDRSSVELHTPQHTACPISKHYQHHLAIINFYFPPNDS